MIGAVQRIKDWFTPAAPARCHTVNVIEGLRCSACKQIIPHVDKYETARILFQRDLTAGVSSEETHGTTGA